jgi:hypothetical protein
MAKGVESAAAATRERDSIAQANDTKGGRRKSALRVPSHADTKHHDPPDRPPPSDRSESSSSLDVTPATGDDDR